MADGIKGDFGKLDELRERMLEVRQPGTRTRLNRLLGGAALTMVREEFAKGVSPNGDPWALLKSRKGQPLLDTGRLRNSFGVNGANAGGFTVGTNVPYAEVHQDGAEITHPPRVNAHARSGRFISRARAGKLKKPVRISYTGTSTSTIPRRQMLPDGDLPKPWERAFNDEADALLAIIFGGE